MFIQENFLFFHAVSSCLARVTQPTSANVVATSDRSDISIAIAIEIRASEVRERCELKEESTSAGFGWLGVSSVPPTQGHKKTSFIHKRNKSFNAHRRVVIRALFSHLAQHLHSDISSECGERRAWAWSMYICITTCRAMRPSKADRTIFVVEQMKPALLCRCRCRCQ